MNRGSAANTEAFIDTVTAIKKGWSDVKNVESEFDEVFGLYVQVCWTSKDGDRYYTSGSDDNKSLTQLNREKEAEGAKKGEWK